MNPLVEQLWGPGLEAGCLQLGWDRRGARQVVADAGWREVERYYVVPGASRPTMLLPAAPAPALSGALHNYRGLRTTRRQLQRRVLGGAALLGTLPFPQVALRVRASEELGTRANPLGELAAGLGRDDLRAAIGVRTGANRKATLQLVDVAGDPVGFAKFSWSEQTALAVEREARALSEKPLEGTCHRPALLTSGTYFGWPYLVSAPLPLSSRAVRGSVAAPSVQEFYDLAPITDRRPLGASGHVRALDERLQALEPGQATGPLVGRAVRLLAQARASEQDLLISERWHGDLTPWNSARDSEDHLWLWDWETSEADTVAGLDAIHWHLSLVQEAGGTLDGKALSNAVRAAAPVLAGLGHPRGAAPVLTAVYVAVMVERAVALSIAEGGWEAGWLGVDDLDDMLGFAEHGLTTS